MDDVIVRLSWGCYREALMEDVIVRLSCRMLS